MVTPQCIRGKRKRPLDSVLAVWSRPQGWLELKALLRDICYYERDLVDQIVAQTGLMLACKGGHASVVDYLLKHEATVNQREPLVRASALHVAAAKGDPAVLSSLLACGADVSEGADRPVGSPLWGANSRE